MRTFWHEGQLAHRPASEFFNGALHPAADKVERAEHILAAIGRTEAPHLPDEATLQAILEDVHSADYLALLSTAHAEWRAAGREGDAMPYAFPVRRRPLRLERIDARLGQHSYDTCTPVAEGTWPALLAGTATVLGALEAVLGGEHAFALTRPPGHHAGTDTMGGYSYLNWAAIAAIRSGRRTAVLDIDYHHGNGTQDMLAGREGLSFASIHADPVSDYPYFWGHADENGDNIRNWPLPRGTLLEAYDAALAEGCAWIGEQSPELLVVSFGADTWEGDPISHFALRTEDYARLARRIAGLGLPTLVVMEGGYAVEALGHNVASFLSGF
ncbi:histone deacetylase family protein [Sphingomonas swuensis]|uniref:Histone deacetylase family protein n=2 Tax=Sphingomonas swuensis TaxID=977800 RepID=A0ABP7S8M5_9SPHN